MDKFFIARPCANEWCPNEIDIRRASLGRVGSQNYELCAPCNRANLASERAKDIPQFTRDNATYDPAPNSRAYGVA